MLKVNEEIRYLVGSLLLIMYFVYFGDYYYKDFFLFWDVGS